MVLHDLIDLGHELLAEVNTLQLIAIFAENTQEVPYVLLVRVRHSFLNDGGDGVVTELVDHELLEEVPLLALIVLPRQEDLEHHLLHRVSRVLEQALDDRAGELRAAISAKVGANNLGHGQVDCLLTQLYDLADDVVGELIADQVAHVDNYFLDEAALLLGTARLEARLHDTAALSIRGHLATVLDESCIDGLFVSILREVLEAVLQHVVTVDVRRQL